MIKCSIKIMSFNSVQQYWSKLWLIEGPKHTKNKVYVEGIYKWHGENHIFITITV